MQDGGSAKWCFWQEGEKLMFDCAWELVWLFVVCIKRESSCGQKEKDVFLVVLSVTFSLLLLNNYCKHNEHIWSHGSGRSHNNWVSLNTRHNIALHMFHNTDS
jgi:hypothetical protein